MKIKKLILALLPLLLLYNCATQKIQVKTITKTIRDTVYIKETTKIKQGGVYKAAQLKNFKISDKHYPSYGHDSRVKHLVFHYTALSQEASIRVLTEQEVSSHYLIPDTLDDDIFVLVSEDKRAWHAGYSHWLKRDNINDTSIGIEIVNKGYIMDGADVVWASYPENQIKKLAELAKDIIQRYEIEPVNVVGHSDVAPQRKYDPGPLFPWKRLYDEYGIGAWYDEADKQKYMRNFNDDRMNQVYFILSVQKDLAKYGYEIRQTGSWDTQTQKVMRAFQQHFRPSNYSGNLDAESWAILKSLLKKYRS